MRAVHVMEFIQFGTYRIPAKKGQTGKQPGSLIGFQFYLPPMQCKFRVLVYVYVYLHKSLFYMNLHGMESSMGM